MPVTQQVFDVVIIGSGGGGAPIAHTLVNAGKSVLVIEKGPLFRPQNDDPMGLSDYKRDELISDGPEKRLMVPGLVQHKRLAASMAQGPLERRARRQLHHNALAQ